MTTDAPDTTQHEPVTDAVALVAMVAVTKHFPGVVALDHLDFELHGGEVHALLGENGAGKSTLTRIIAGDYRADGGTLLIAGQEVIFDSPRDARAAGIRIVTQERTLVPTLSVAENIFLGELPIRPRVRTVDWSTLRVRARVVLERIGLDLDPEQELARLRPAQQQLVEIARAISGVARVLILDEPTAALSGHDAARLFDVVRALRAQGVGILYISHRVGELAGIADRVTVLRDGRRVYAAPLSETTPETLVRAMVGRSVGSIYPTRVTAPGETILELADVSVAGICQDISLDVRHGEIVGVFGLVGSGATEIPYVAAGDLPSSGTIKREAKVGLIPADRRAEGIFPKGTMQRNIGAASMGRFMRRMTFRRRLERSAAARQIGALRIKPANPVAPIAGVSGGNQQKAILGRWLERGTDLLLLSEPTRGVDVGARAEIYEIFGNLCEAGTGILLASSDIDEVAGLCDRAYVMVRGRMTTELRGPDLTVERLLVEATR